ncbi:MAG: hypothetical protein WAW54_10075, partial [Parvibaculum sedimenti]
VLLLALLIELPLPVLLLALLIELPLPVLLLALLIELPLPVLLLALSILFLPLLPLSLVAPLLVLRLFLLLVTALVFTMLPVFCLGKARISTQCGDADHGRKRNPNRRLSNAHHRVPPYSFTGKVPAMVTTFPCGG